MYTELIHVISVADICSDDVDQYLHIQPYQYSLSPVKLYIVFIGT